MHFSSLKDGGMYAVTLSSALAADTYPKTAYPMPNDEVNS